MIVRKIYNIDKRVGMEKELPVRKKIRLDGYDYSQAGYYFITICVEDGHEMLGRIVVGDAEDCVPYKGCNSPYCAWIEVCGNKTNRVFYLATKLPRAYIT